MPAQTLIDALFADKVLSKEQIEQIKSETINTGKSPEELIRVHRFATDEQLIAAKAATYNIPYINLVGKTVSTDVLNLIPESVARRYIAFPIELDASGTTLSVAMADPLDVQVIEFLEQKSGKRVKPYMAEQDSITTAIDEQYAHNLGAEVTAALKETSVSQIRTIQAERLGEIIREAPIAKIVSTLLEYAIKGKASDIHIEPQETKTRVRYRIDGILQEKLALPKGVHDAVISRIKILCNMKIDEKRIPQDGRFNYRLGGDEVDLRVSTLPTVDGEKIVMRLLRKSGGIPTMQDLGLRGTALKNLEANISRPHGIILITGPTGSGKTTTLYAILSKLNTTRVNIMTLEDPVEYQIAGVNQVQINPVAGLTFATGLRSFLRQDPNIILVGEIRDSETTKLAVQAALTGHLVFSTLHTNSAAGAIPRLLDLGAEAFLVASSLNAIVGQRIARKICASCKEEYVPQDSVVADIKAVLGKLYPNQTAPLKLFRGKGCPACSDTGYTGRMGIFEVVAISGAMSKLILEHAALNEIEKCAIEEGMITMKQDGYLKVLEGITTIEEILRIAQD